MNRKSLFLVAPKSLKWVDVALDNLLEDDLLVKTTSTAISIGTELSVYRNCQKNSNPLDFPIAMGYESVGLVEAIGENVKTFKKGDRILAFYGHKEYCVINQKSIVKIPPEVSEEEALLSILSCDVSRGIQKIAPKQNDSVIIVGGGAMGALTLNAMIWQEIETIDVIESDKNKHTMHTYLGANSVRTRPEGKDYAIGFFCCDSPAAFYEQQRVMKNGGKICVLSDGNKEYLSLSPYFHEKELIIYGSSDGKNYEEYSAFFFEKNLKNLVGLFDFKIKMSDLIDTFKRLDQGEIAPFKILVQY